MAHAVDRHDHFLIFSVPQILDVNQLAILGTAERANHVDVGVLDGIAKPHVGTVLVYEVATVRNRVLVDTTVLRTGPCGMDHASEKRFSIISMEVDVDLIAG